MDVIETKAQMTARWARPIVTVLQPKAQAYQKIVDKLGEYEEKCLNGTLNLDNQVTLLNDIDKACRDWILANKGAVNDQATYIDGLQKKVIKLIDSKNTSINYNLMAWYQQGWCWNKLVEKSAKRSCHEPFQFVEAIEKWKEDLSNSRQGAWYIMATFVTPIQGIEVGLEEGDQDPAAVLGEPIARANISYDACNTIVGTPDAPGTIRRADSTMFNASIEELNNATTFQEVRVDNFFKALGTHIVTEVSGPFPQEAPGYHCEMG